MIPILVLAALLLPGAVLAQPRPFTCVGAEQLEDDVFDIPFPRGAAAPGEAARTNLSAAAERAKQAPERMLCVLGHTGSQEGGAQTGVQLAARRAGAVAEALAKLGVERDRIRAEARRAAFARRAAPEERSVTVVILPPRPEPGLSAPAAPAGSVPPSGTAGVPAAPAPPPPNRSPATR